MAPLNLLRTLANWAGVMIVLIATASCGKVDRPSPAVAEVKAPPGGVLLRGAGATFPSLLYEAWFTDYMKEHPKTVITYDAVGSGAGIKRFIGEGIPDEDRVDFGASDAAMKDDEMTQVERGVQLLPVTGGSVVLAYNLPDYRKELKLSREAYAGIFLGKVKSWDDPLIRRQNPTLETRDLSMVTVVRQDSSGTTFALTNHLKAINPEWRERFGARKLVDWPGAAMMMKGNEGVAGRIKQAVGSIGYVEYGFAKKLGLQLAWLENRAGHFVRPSEFSGQATLAAMDLPDNLRAFVPDPKGQYAYPIVTLSWILLYQTYEEPAKSASIRDLFHWCLKQGQLYSGDLGYIPLAPNVLAKSRAALDALAP